MNQARTTDQFDWQEELALIPTPLDQLIPGHGKQDDTIDVPTHPYDSEPMQALHSRLMMLYRQEMDRQHFNRMQQAVDAGFYDGKQWTAEDAAALEKRGQVPIVFNHIKPVINWLLGNETRNRTDFKVLGRGPEDVKAAEIKTSYVKYLSDANTMSHHQSLAFADCIKVGVGWLEDGVQYADDDDEIYSRHVSWRQMLWDSRSTAYNLKDARYLFRQGYYDVDMVVAAYKIPQERLATVLSVRPGYQIGAGADELLEAFEEQTLRFAGHISDAQRAANIRARVLLVEAWYRVPEMVAEFRGGPLHRQRWDGNNPEHKAVLATGQCEVIERLRTVMRCCIMTEGGILWEGASPYKHNEYPYTPIWCYRDDETLLPYGLIRDLRDLQYDVNKRASKALYILSTNKVVMDKGAVDDIDEFAEEVAQPDAIIEKNKGYELVLNVDRELAAPHLELMRMSAAQIQSSSGVTDEQLGRTTNAVSGTAITARQDQGALQTASIFDALRYARQWQGQKVLANIEQFVSAEKVIRVTNAKGKEEFLRLNDPNLPESVMAATQADFIISDTPQAASFRLGQAEQISNVLSRMPPDVAALFLPTLLDLLDVPNKEETIKLLRGKLGIPDPDAEQTPEQLAQQQEAQRQQQLQAAMQELQLEETRNKSAKLKAETQHIEAKTVREKVAAMGDAVQAAATATQAAPIAATADDMLASAGFAAAEVAAEPAAPAQTLIQPMPAQGQLQPQGAM